MTLQEVINEVAWLASKILEERPSFGLLDAVTVAPHRSPDCFILKVIFNFMKNQ